VLLASLRPSHRTYEHTSRGRVVSSGPPEQAVSDVFQRFSTASHPLWGCVVPDIPTFCRELVAAFAEK
jgi:hypothetical protein